MSDDADPIPHVIRDMRDDDRNFVVETTLKVRQPRGLRWREWESLRKPGVEAMVKRGTVLVADAGGVLLGFALVDRFALRMLYVKRDFRGDGLGLELLRSAFINPRDVVVDNPTASFRAWARLHGIAWTVQGERVTA